MKTSRLRAPLLCKLVVAGALTGAIPAAALGGTQPAAASPQAVSAAPPDPATAAARLAGIAVPFVEEDEGADIRFSARIFAGALGVSARGELVYAVHAAPVIARDADSRPEPRLAPPAERIRAAARAPARTIVERFVDGAARPAGLKPSPTRVSRFVGADPGRYRTALRAWDQLALGEVFPGVDVRLRATTSNVEKIYELHPGADPARIRMAIDGAQSLRVAADGALVAATESGDIAFTAPIAFQQIDGERRPVRVAYALDATSHRYSFEVGPYDTSRPLVIDPFLQGTYFGATGYDLIQALAVNGANGEIIVGGYTSSTDLPCTTAATPGCGTGAQSAPAPIGGTDAFVARFSADLKTLLQVSYLGGSGTYEYIQGVAWHPVTGEVIVTGATESTDFPCVSVMSGCSNGAQPYYVAANDIFVARFSADLTALRQATYYGGSGDDYPNGVVIHPATGDIIIYGTTQSTTLFCMSIATLCAKGAQDTHAADMTYDGFVLRLSSDLLHFKQGTYVGGIGVDSVYGVAVDPGTGDIYAAGTTVSNALPCTTLLGTCANAAQMNFGGGAQDGFVVRLSADLTQWKQATYIGGNQSDGAQAIAFHPIAGELIVGGITGSANFPCITTLGVCRTAPQTAIAAGGQYDAFVTRISRDLTQFRQSTYFGGSSNETVSALAVHPVSGEIYISATTYSPNLPCATANGTCANGAMTPPASAAQGKLYVARYSPDLLQLRQTTYYGGNAADQFGGMTLHPASGDVVLAGYTLSTDLPCTTAGGGCGDGAQKAHAADNFSYDGFVVRISPDLSAVDTTPAPFAFVPKSGVAPSSLQTSAPVKITGLGASTSISISGQAGSAYCAATMPDCTSCDVSGDFVTTPGSIFNNNYVCARQTAPAGANAESFVTVQVGAQAGRFYVSTGGAIGTGCSLDADGNGDIDALTDGLIILRALLGMTGSAVTTDATGPNPTRGTWDLIRPFLNGNCGTTFGP